MSPIPNNPSKRFLVVELADIGDLILTTPALGALRESFPAAQIDVLTTGHAAPILDNSDLADHVITFDKFSFDRPIDLFNPVNIYRGVRLAKRLRSEHYDAVLIFHHLTTRFGGWKYAALAFATGAGIRAGLGNGRGWFLTHRVTDLGFGALHQVEYWLQVVALLGATTQDQRLRIIVSDEDKQWARAHLPAKKTLVAIHPGSGGYSMARRWDAEKFAAVADTVSARATVVIVGGPQDQAETVISHMRHKPINLAGQTTLGQLGAVIAFCDSYIGADLGMMHLAAANLPNDGTLSALFGPSNHKAWGPWRPEATDATTAVIRSGVLCSPCSYVGHTVGLRHGCEARTCMKLIEPEAVLEKQSLSAKKGVRREPALHVLGVPVDSPTFGSMLAQIGAWIEANRTDHRSHQICTVNPEFIMAAQTDINFYNILNRCDLCIPDGVGLLWAAKHLGHVLPERVTGSDGVPLIAERAAQKGWRLFLLGAGPGVAEKTAEILTERYPGLQIAGTYAGTPSAKDEDQIAALVASSRADILFVAYGAPNQDKWIARNLPRLKVKVAMGVGGSFDFIAGVTQRAPLWMRRAGIEWLHRLIQQPWRVWRMLRLPIFVLAVLRRGSRGPAAFVGLNNTGKFS